MEWKLTKNVFGPLWKYIENNDVTDIDWDGDALWIKYCNGNTVRKDAEITPDFIDNFTQYVANHVSKPFNHVDNTLEAETDTLRITVAHESLVTSGRCFSIRKSMPSLRFTATEAVNGYCNKEILSFLVNAVKVKMNFAFCGEPGHGKTEAAKFLSSYILPEDKVITVEDTLEWHYKYINPGKRADEIKVNGSTDYTKSIKLALRLNPTWLMLSEARSSEVQYLIEGWSTGVHGMTTLHTSDVRNIPDRVANMMDSGNSKTRAVNNVYSYLDIGVLLQEVLQEDGTKRRQITQVGLFLREHEENKYFILYDHDVIRKEELPYSVLELFRRKGVIDPFRSEELEQRLIDEQNGIFYGTRQTKDTKIDEEDFNTENISSNDEIFIDHIDPASILNTIERA